MYIQCLAHLWPQNTFFVACVFFFTVKFNSLLDVSPDHETLHLMPDIHCITSNEMIHNSFYHNYDSVYQALDVVFHDQVKHREES